MSLFFFEAIRIRLLGMHDYAVVGNYVLYRLLKKTIGINNNKFSSIQCEWMDASRQAAIRDGARRHEVGSTH